MKKVVTFGESLLRLTPPGFERYLQSPRFEATFGGAEANVAVALASFGLDAVYVTVLPENNAIADAVISELRRFAVDTSRIVRAKGRLGIYFVEAGANQRPSRVVYDREHSAMALAKPGDIDWGKAFDGAGWFHITGITPAISPSAAELAMESMRKAREAGLTVSCDLNYRRHLWKWGKSPEAVMTEMAAAADILISNDGQLQMVLGLSKPLACEELTHRTLDRFQNLQAIAVTTRESHGASRNVWSGCLNDRKEFITSPSYDITHMVDRIGSGDAFAAGLIYGWHKLESRREALDFAAAASCLKHSIPGDICRITLDEVHSLLSEGGSGRIDR